MSAVSLNPSIPVGYLQLIRQNRNFRLLWFGEVISQLGDWFNLIAIFAILLALTGSAKFASWIIIIRTLPYFFMGPIAGVFADRFNRKTIMILSDILRAIVVLGFLFVKTKEQIWIIYVVTLLEIVLSTFFVPAKSAVVPNVVIEDELVSANALSSATWSVMLTLGSAIGGAVSAIFGKDVCFIVNSLSYIFSAIMIWKVVIPKKPVSVHHLSLKQVHPFRQFIDGIIYVKNKKDTLAYLFVKTGWGLSGGIFLVITIIGKKYFPVYGKAEAGIGILYAARGLGTAIGPIFARKLCGNSQPDMRKWIGFSFLFGGLFFVLLGLSLGIQWFYLCLSLACVTLFLSHFGTSIMWVFSTTLLQLNTTDEIRGRVFASEMGMFTLAMSLSNYLTGVGLDIPGMTEKIMIFILGSMLFLPGILWLIVLSRWNQWTGQKSL